MLIIALLTGSLLCHAYARRGHFPRRLRAAAVTGIALALALSARQYGLERGIAAWLACLMACGALVPAWLLLLERVAGFAPDGLRQRPVLST